MKISFEEFFLSSCALFVIFIAFVVVHSNQYKESKIDKADTNTLKHNPLRMRFAYEKGMFNDGFISNEEYHRIPSESMLKHIYKKDEN